MFAKNKQQRNWARSGRHRSTPLRVESLETRRLLTTFVATTTQDTLDETDGQMSLREAIVAANELPGADIVEFTIDGEEPKTIRLQLGELKITDALSMEGPGPATLTIDAQSKSRVFHITASAGDFVIAGLRLQNAWLTLISQSTTNGRTDGYLAVTRSPSNIEANPQCRVPRKTDFSLPSRSLTSKPPAIAATTLHKALNS